MVRKYKKLVKESKGSTYDMINAIEDRIEELESDYYGESVDLEESSRKKYTQTQLRSMVRNGEAEDITNYSFEEADDLYDRGYDVIGVSSGTYGINGALLRMRDTDELLVITSRNSTLLQLV